MDAERRLSVNPFSLFDIIELKQLETKDFEDVAAGCNRLLPQLSNKERGPVEAELLLRISKNPNFWLFLVRKRQTGEILGMASCFLEERIAGPLAELHDIVVDQKIVDMGLGTALVQKLMAHLSMRASELKRAVEVFLTSNPTRVKAHEIYLRFGFRLIARCEGVDGTNLYKLTLPPQG